MSVRNDKEKIIREMMNLRTLIREIWEDAPKLIRDKAFEKKKEAQEKLNSIQDMIFNI